MEVTLLSRETIKPSSPTPPRLETFPLWRVDKLSPLVYTPLLFFYSMNNNDEAIATLKTSLSETLNRFFFLEGEFFDTSIHCNYEEVIFIEARVKCNMSDILREPKDEVLMKLLLSFTLCTNSDEKDEKYAQIVVQANVFNCGGVAISLCLLHELMDSTTLSCFLRSWVSINNEAFGSFPNIVCSDFGPLSSLFDPRQREGFSSNSETKSDLQRLVFKEDAISNLKDEVVSSNIISNPTRVEVLIGFIWKCALKIASARSGSQRPSSSVLTHAINLQNRKQPSSPEFSVGNFWWVVVADHYLANETHVELSELVSLLRKSFEKINGDYIKSLVGNEEGAGANTAKLLEERDNLRSSNEIIPKLCICTSWENMDLNEVDFKWGNAIWIGTSADSNTTTKNIAILLRTVVSGDGIEVWIILDEKEMDLLIQDPEFLKFALSNPTTPPP